MRSRVSVLLAMVAVSCAHHASNMPPDSVARPAPGVPTRFLYDGSAFTSDSVDLHACRSPLLDPNDGVKVVLIRTDKGSRGDYEVPSGRYGIGPNDLLRINCKTGGVIGIVPR
jgi:hypothetical protein